MYFRALKSSLMKAAPPLHYGSAAAMPLCSIPVIIGTVYAERRHCISARAGSKAELAMLGNLIVMRFQLWA